MWEDVGDIDKSAVANGTANYHVWCNHDNKLCSAIIEHLTLESSLLDCNHYNYNHDIKIFFVPNHI